MGDEAEAEADKGPECTLVARDRCKSGRPKVDGSGTAYLFAESSMAWETVEALSKAANPGRVLCFDC